MVRSGKVLSIKGLSSHQNMNLYHAMCHFYMMVSVYSTILYGRLFICPKLIAIVLFCFFVGKPLQLSLVAEEVATFYAKMLDHEYTAKEAFQSNFFTDWREVSKQFICCPQYLTFSGFAIRSSFFIGLVCPALSIGNDRR